MSGKIVGKYIRIMNMKKKVSGILGANTYINTGTRSYFISLDFLAIVVWNHLNLKTIHQHLQENEFRLELNRKVKYGR